MFSKKPTYKPGTVVWRWMHYFGTTLPKLEKVEINNIRTTEYSGGRIEYSYRDDCDEIVEEEDIYLSRDAAIKALMDSLDGS